MGRGKKIVDIELVAEEAVALIEEGGLEEFSTRRLASRLGISAMTLYNYYENRGAIIRDALGRGLGLLWKGLGEKVASLRAEGANPLRAYLALAEHLLAFALERPRLCRFILTEGAGGGWSCRDGQIESICGPGSSTGAACPEPIPRDIYLFELLVFALALKVVGGGETAKSYRELVGQGYELLLGRHEASFAQSST